MVTTKQMRAWWYNYRCINQRPSLQKLIQMFGRNAGYSAIPAYDMLKAAEMALVATGYEDVKSVWVPRNCPTGIAGKTCEPDGTNCSLHNYGIPFDIDPFAYGNPHFYRAWGGTPSGWSRPWDFRDCKLTREQVEAVEAIKNTYGEVMFRWLGWVNGDTMHFEPQVPPDRAKVDWTTVKGFMPEEPEGGDDPVSLPLEEGDQGEDVRLLQDRLNLTYAAGLSLSGKYDDATVTACKAYIGKYTGNQNGKDGLWVGGKQWSRMSQDFIEKVAKGEVGPPGPQGPQGPVGPEGPQGPPGDGEGSGTVTLTIKADTTLEGN